MMPGQSHAAPAIFMVKVFREFGNLKQREQWPVDFDLEGVDRNSQVRKQKLETEANMSRSLSSNSFVGNASIDLNKPAREAYRHQEYPKMLYHQTKKDPIWLAEFRRVTLYNSLHPEKPELLPTVPAAFVMVNNETEEKMRFGQGFQLRPPAEPPQAEEFAELAGEVLCSRGCGAAPHRGSCKPVTVTA